MSNEKLYVRVKRAVEEQRRKSVQGETRVETLQAEEKRIFENITKELGYDANSLEELESVLAKNKTEIEEHVQEVANVLDEEGIDY